MKKTLLIVFAMAAMMLSSCSKDETASFCGSYSFKTGGYVEVKTNILDSTVVRYISPESGQMRILQDSGKNVKVTMNVLGGSPVAYDGVVENGVLRLNPTKREVKLYRDILFLDFVEAVLTVGGEGRKYDGSLVINMDYQGTYASSFLTGDIISSNVTCIATRNE